MLRTNVEKHTILLGIVVFIISYIVPVNLFNKFTELKPLGISTIFICPVLGIMGLIFSIKRKSIPFIFLNLLLLLSFPIAMCIGNIIFK